MDNERLNLLKRSPVASDREECAKLLSEYLITNPLDIIAWYDLASCLDFLGFEDEAEFKYQKVYDMGVKNLPIDQQPEFYVGYGSTLRNNQKLHDSKTILKEGCEAFPKFGTLKIFLAFTLFSLREFENSAKILFEMCGSLPPETFEAYVSSIKKYSSEIAKDL